MKRKIWKTYSKKKIRFGNSKAKENLGIELNFLTEWKKFGNILTEWNDVSIKQFRYKSNTWIHGEREKELNDLDIE